MISDITIIILYVLYQVIHHQVHHSKTKSVAYQFLKLNKIENDSMNRTI